MSRTLLLTSTGITNSEIRDALLKNLERPADKSSIGYIKNAWDVENDMNYIRWVSHSLKLTGLEIRGIDLRVLKGNTLEKKLDEVDIIYVGGGNTYYLLDLIRKSGFDKILPKLLDDGKVYVGASAGSIVVGPDIKMARDDRNVVEMRDFKGIGIVPFVVVPHFETDPFVTDMFGKGFVALARRQLRPYCVEVLSDAQAILVKGNEMTLVGEKLMEIRRRI